MSHRTRSGSRAAVATSLLMSVLQTASLAVAAAVTGAAALTTQTINSVADVAGSVFLMVGVLSSGRPADDRHPLGYGRERFFWSFVAAVGIFVGGFGTALAETVSAVAHPDAPTNHTVGYAVLGVTIGLDLLGLRVGMRPLLDRSRQRGRPLLELLWRGSDPAVTTVVLTSGAGVLGGLLAAAGLAGAQLTGSTWADAVASGLIAIVLLVTSLVLLHTNRELLTGRGLSPAAVEAMRQVVLQQAGVLAVPDLFAVIVGPESCLVGSDVVFDDALDVPAVEAAVVQASAALRARWPVVTSVHLTPVAARRAGGRGRPPVHAAPAA